MRGESEAGRSSIDPSEILFASDLPGPLISIVRLVTLYVLPGEKHQLEVLPGEVDTAVDIGIELDDCYLTLPEPDQGVFVG